VKPSRNQRSLFAALDCEPDQTDLFPTDGAPEALREPLTVYQQAGAWWVACEPYEALGATHDAYGPYKTRAEAEEDARGLRRSARLTADEIVTSH
jgi:hypothetical protein